MHVNHAKKKLFPTSYNTHTHTDSHTDWCRFDWWWWWWHGIWQVTHTDGGHLAISLARCSVVDLETKPDIRAVSSGTASSEGRGEREERKKALAPQINRADVLTSSITVSQTHDNQNWLQRKVGISLDLTDGRTMTAASLWLWESDRAFILIELLWILSLSAGIFQIARNPLNKHQNDYTAHTLTLSFNASK